MYHATEGGLAALAPVVVDVISGLEGEGVSCDSGNVGSEAVRTGGLALHEVPEGDAAGGAGDGGDAGGVGAGWHGGGGTRERENDAGDA